MAKIQHYEADVAVLDRLGWLCLAMGLLALMSLMIWRRKNTLQQLLAMVMALVLPVSTLGYALLEPYRTPQNIMQSVAAVVPDNGQVGIVAFRSQYLLYADRPLVHFGFHTPVDVAQKTAWQWMNAQPGRWLMAPESAVMPCFNQADSILLGVAHREVWRLYPVQALQSECPGGGQTGRIFSAQ